MHFVLIQFVLVYHFKLTYFDDNSDPTWWPAQTWHRQRPVVVWQPDWWADWKSTSLGPKPQRRWCMVTGVTRGQGRRRCCIWNIKLINRYCLDLARKSVYKYMYLTFEINLSFNGKWKYIVKVRDSGILEYF